MSSRASRRLNAVIHGAFAKTAILPGEDPAEFEELHSALIEEWVPVGPTEEDAVLSIAKGIWRKRRAQKFLDAQVERCRFVPEHPLYDEGRRVLRFFTILETAPFVGFVDTEPDVFQKLYDALVGQVLPEDDAKYLAETFPRESFKSGSAWLEAVRNEIVPLCCRRIKCPARSPVHYWPEPQNWSPRTCSNKNLRWTSASML
jgi:hypothetical protein